MKDVNQALYDELFRRIQEFATVYTVNPPEGTALPFVQMGATQIIPVPNKTFFLANAYQVIDVWGSGDERKTVSDLASQILQLAYRLKTSPEGYRFSLDLDATSCEMMIDNSTNEDLWRARLSLKFSVC